MTLVSGVRHSEIAHLYTLQSDRDEKAYSPPVTVHSYCDVTDRGPHAVLHIPVTYLCYYYKSAPFNSLGRFACGPTIQPSGNCAVFLILSVCPFV